MSNPANDVGQQRPETSNARYARILSTGRNTERTIFFSDAVMAIAMTLLILQIQVPESSQVSARDLPAVLADDSVALYAYALSFALIGMNWITHHRKFTVIERYTGRLQWINLGYLFFIAILPLPTRLLSDYGPTSSLVVILYAVVIAATALFQFWLWAYARRAGLFSAVVDDGMYRYSRRNILPLPIVFGFSIVLCLVIGPGLAMYSWLLMIPVMIITGRYRPKAERQAQKRRRPRRA